MNRFFTQKENIDDNTVKIVGDDVAHIQKVLRMREGDKMIVCDGDNTDYICAVKSIDKTCVLADILEKCKNVAEPQCKITLFQGLPKGDKMEQLIQKCVEIGVCTVSPVMTKRVVAKGDKGVRWQKVAIEAAKQCGRGVVPPVLPVISFADALKDAAGFDLAIIPYEEEEKVTLKEVLRGKNVKNVAVFIGPEGGFEKDEITLAVQNGIIPVTLGKRILRTETAGMNVISNIIYEYEGEKSE